MEININVLQGVALVLIVATFARYVLKWSAKDFLAFILKEFKELLALTPSAGALNALALIMTFVVIAAGMIIPKFEKILSLGGVGSSTSPGLGAIFGSALVILIGGLVCVTLVRSNK